MFKAFNKVNSKLRHWSQVRFREPVVVFESDDWGMWRSPADKSYIETIGKPKVWAYDQLESVEELSSLYDVLESKRDVLGCAPKIVANFITANPDFKATMASGYREIILSPVSKSDAKLVELWRKGLSKGIFIPQYHGRLHFNEATLLRDLQHNEKSRNIFEAGWHGGVNNLVDGGWHLHSEYLDWEAGTDLNTNEAKEWIHRGMLEFKSLFGFLPQSTIAPQYIFSPAMAKVFADAGFTAVQGTNMQQYKIGAKGYTRRLPMGSQLYAGLVALGRNVKFEPARGNKDWKSEKALTRAGLLIKEKVPVVIDSHRINYVGKFGSGGRHELMKLLDGLEKLDVRYLTTFELADAIKNNGEYTDFITGTKNSLTPFEEGSAKRFVRNRLR